MAKDEGDIVREYQAMHEESFLSSWLMEDVEDKEERKRKVNKDREEVAAGRAKEEGREERTKRWLLKEGVSALFPVMLLRIQSRGGFGQ